MKFIDDAQLPKRLADHLTLKGYDAIHTLELPDQNATPDTYITQKALNENRIVVSKDTDFLDTYLLKHEPQKLILVRTGNISNNQLILLFDMNLDLIITELEKYSLLEIRKDTIIVHKNE